MPHFTHAFCDVCDDIRPVEQEPLTAPDWQGRYLGGDITCTVCHYIIATVYVAPNADQKTREIIAKVSNRDPTDKAGRAE